MNITEELFAMQDEKYKAFQAKLIPTVERERIIGIRTPQLRKFARSICASAEAETFIKELPHKYYEEDNLHAFLIEKFRDFDRALELTEQLLPYINNWATCDMFLPPVFKKNKGALIPRIKHWLKSDKTYTVRYGMGLLMSLYLDTEFEEEYLELVASVQSEEYYINMMIAWYFATALAKQYKAALPYLTGYRLSAWVHNKTIQKAIESSRIPADTKEYLRTLKIKGRS